MNKVRINKEKLLNQLQKNRNEHKVIYEEAMAGWEEQVVKGLKKALKKAEAGKEYITDLDLETPPCHLDEYDNIIERVNWHEDEIIELDHREFNQFVLDKWDWQHYFLMSASSYSSSSSSSGPSSSTLSQKMASLKIS